jgi:hypothetical protein
MTIFNRDVNDPKQQEFQYMISIFVALFWSRQVVRQGLVTAYDGAVRVTQFTSLSYADFHDWLTRSPEGVYVVEHFGSTQGPQILLCNLPFYNHLVGIFKGGGGGTLLLDCPCTDTECCNGDTECMNSIDFNSEYDSTGLRKRATLGTLRDEHLNRRGAENSYSYSATEPGGNQVILHMTSPRVCNPFEQQVKDSIYTKELLETVPIYEPVQSRRSNIS